MNKINIKIDEVFQVFLIIFKNSIISDYLDLLEELGEFRFTYSNNNKDSGQIVYINTNKSIDYIVKILDSVRADNSEYSVIGMTLDMMDSLSDLDDKRWCLEKQESNMKYILEITQRDEINNFSKVLDEVEKELLRIEKERREES